MYHFTRKLMSLHQKNIPAPSRKIIADVVSLAEGKGELATVAFDAHHVLKLGASQDELL